MTKKLKPRLIVSVAVSIIFAAPVLAASDKPAPPVNAPRISETRAVVSPDLALYLVRTTLMSIHDANLSGNYTVLRDLSGPSLQKRSASDFANLFGPLRERNLDLFSAALMVPAFTSQPQVGSDNHLHLTGRFTTRPKQLVFDFVFEVDGGTWKPSSLSVGLQIPAN